MSHERLRPTFTFDEDRLRALKNIAPEAFADGKINWETLREALGDFTEDEAQEHFGLLWPGKHEARRAASLPPQGTLAPVYGEGLKRDGSPDSDGYNDSQNVFIEGENLEVLKILQKAYAGRIKMIYIDPPYNTGNDFVYDDNYTEPLREYLRRTGQTDEEGKPLTTNKRADGRFHSKWLSMMYPRLRLARNLLRDDGVIFVSIDDNEVHNLRALMTEVFGEENFIENIIWKKRYGGGAKEKYLVTLHEYILVYAKNIEEIAQIFIPLDTVSIERYYKQKDENFEKKGPYRTHPLEATKSVGRRENLVFGIPGPEGKEIWPERQWWWDKRRVLEALKNGELEFSRSKTGKWTVNTKQYLKEANGEIRKTKPFSIMDKVYTQHGTSEIADIFGDSKYFAFPKPSELITQLIDIANPLEDDIVLDFFAGSASTAHAVWKKTVRDRVNLRFLLAQLPETIDPSELSYQKGLRTISEISKKRLGLTSSKFTVDSNHKHDLGFKSLKLIKSNFRVWSNLTEMKLDNIEKQFDLFQISLIQYWNSKELLFEITLLEGFPLHSAVVAEARYTHNTVQRVSCDFHQHSLLICLDEEIKPETIRSLDLGENDVFICLDSAITDQDKLRLSDKGLIKTI